ncbi:MAG TPA: amino acid permease [Casimicrobiaceae bacterium]|nr:amino acid permease [Casimicrobiaceae bacterium]
MTRASVGSLRRTLGFTDLVMLTLGTVIGSGIFLVPAIVLRQTGERFGLAMAVWAVGGFVSFLGALTYAELGGSQPEAGGLYAYIRDAFGPLPAFLYGWTSFLVIASGSCAALAVAFSNYLGQIVPLGTVAARVVSVLLIAGVATINIVGARRSSTVENWATGAKVGALLIISGVLVAIGRGMSAAPVASTAAPPSTLSLLSGAGAAMIGVLWAYEGWQYVTFAAGETREPQRVFPRAIAVATGALIVLYLLANLGYVAALGLRGAAASDHVAADAMRAAFGPASGTALVVLVLVSIFSAANGLTLSAPRMYYAMARDGLFFARLRAVNPRFGTPVAAIVLYAIWSAVLAATGTFQQLLTYVVFAGWIFYALGALSVFGSRRKFPERPRPFLTPFYPVTPALFAIAAALLVANTLVTQTREAVIGLAAVACGVPVLFAWRTRVRRHPLTVEPPTTELSDASTVS